jgi:Xaa-Pro dipeptidase
MVEQLSNKERVIQYGRPALEAPFSLDEYRERLDRVRAIMEREGIDLLYLGTPESMFYLSGYQAEWYQANSPKIWPPICGVAVHRDHDKFILFDQIWEAVLCRYTTVSTDTRYYTRESQYSAVDFIVSELKSEGWTGGTVGLEMGAYRPNRNVSHQFQAAFEAAGCTVVDGTNIVREARRIKSPTELSYMKTAMQIAEIGMQAAWDTLEPGITELDVYAEMIAAMAHAGGENPAITLPVLSGMKTATPHGLASRKQIMPGEIVVVDICGVYNRYHANMARTFSMGEPHPDVAEVIHKSAQSFDVLNDTVHPGLPVRDLNTTMWNYYEETGILEDHRWIGGYEMGLAFPPDWVGEFVYDPNLDPGDSVFEPGMVVNYESQVFLPRMAGMSLLIDSIMFTEDDAGLMSDFPRDLIVVE